MWTDEANVKPFGIKRALHTNMRTLLQQCSTVEGTLSSGVSLLTLDLDKRDAAEMT